MPELEAGHATAGILKVLGPMVLVRIGFDVNWRPEGRYQPNLPPDPLPALVDTGSTDSLIDASLATDLGLPAIGQEPITGVHGTGHLVAYVGQILIPGLGYTQYGRFLGAPLLSNGQPFVALLGRSFLAHVRMIYDGSSGSVVIVGP